MKNNSSSVYTPDSDVSQAQARRAVVRTAVPGRVAAVAGGEHVNAGQADVQRIVPETFVFRSEIVPTIRGRGRGRWLLTAVVHHARRSERYHRR